MTKPARALRFMLAAAALGAALPAQRLRVVSEFQRYTPSGTVIEDDRISQPREIISPAVARNAFASFRVVVQLPADTEYSLHVAQNPDGVIKATLYQETYQKQGESWVPDGLKAVELSIGGRLQNQTAQSHLLDLWVPADAKPQRVRVELQLSVGTEWTIVPLEVRISNTTVELLPEKWSSLQAYACGQKDLAVVPKPASTLAWIAFRNAQQDIAMARAREKAESPGAVAKTLARAAGLPSREEFCTAPPPRGPKGPEWVLRARDYLILGLPLLP